MLSVIYICRDLSVLSGPHPPPCGPLTLKYKFKIWVTHMTVRGEGEAYVTQSRTIFKTHLKVVGNEKVGGSGICQIVPICLGPW